MNYSYNQIASSYDFLSRLVFGKAQINAQIDQLTYLINNRCILIIGGGTGWILEEISKMNSQAEIVFVEYSTTMIKLAKEVSCKNKVTFIQEDAEFFKSQNQFDAVLSPFLFDNFDERKAKAVFENLDSLLEKQGLWLHVDFQPKGRLWKKVLLKTMYIFFRLIKAVNTKQFVAMDSYFLNRNYTLVEEQLYYWDFIVAKVFRKTQPRLKRA